jgi:xyloglucan-specific exo-beta-1,4-glucanase
MVALTAMTSRRLRILTIAAIACAGAAGAAPAAQTPYTWRNVAVGAGGFAPNIVFSRAEQGLAYLRTDMGGAYRWDSRADAWIPLQDGNAESSYMGVESIAPDPSNPDVVYIAAGMGAWGAASIQRSADRGATWAVVPVPFKMGGNEDGRGLGERLAVDPANTATLYFGSRHDGLQRSFDSGATWSKVASFPHPGLGTPTQRRQTHAGVSFILFGPGGAIYAAVADPTAQHLYRSTDAGRSWAAVAGGPDLLPVKAEIDAHGRLYVVYCSSIGPNGIATGAVWRLDTPSGRWTDITPDKTSEGGFMGLSLDRQRPGRLVVSSVDRWHPGDTVWLSEDAGATWRDLSKGSVRDVSASPFLKLGRKEADFGHWTAGLAVDPFDSRHIAYTTGATVYGTRDLKLWKPWVKGIEQTAVITLVSPTGGAPLISGFGDIAGFVHDDLAVSPPFAFSNPQLSNTNNLDYAGANPSVVVRSGSAHNPAPDQASLAWSGDGGHSWSPLKVAGVVNGEASITVSADGAVFAVSAASPVVSSDRGASWTVSAGLPTGARIYADKVAPRRFYAVDFVASRLFASVDGGKSFTPLPARGLPDLAPALPRNREAQAPLAADPSRAGEIWLKVSGALYRSRDGGRSFERRTAPDIDIEQFGLGRGSVFAITRKGQLRAIFRSQDSGASWTRINDDAHQWGLRFRAIAGDPRRRGRVYLATDGRGLFYGDPSPPPARP